jgi:aldose 1-epimerase
VAEGIGSSCVRYGHPVRLSYRDQTCELVLTGGRVVRYDVGGVPVLTPLPLPATAYQSALLAPWPNRVARGSWTWQGQSLQLPVNEADPGSSLHGLVHSAPFAVVAQTVAAVRLRHELAPSPGYPFSLRIEAAYELTDEGLDCELSATNTSDRPAPVALGVHPYLDTRGRVDEVLLAVPATRTVATDERWLEVGRPAVDGTGWDLRSGRRLAGMTADTTWTGLEPRGDRITCSLELPGGDVVTIWGGSTCRYVVVYSADTLPDPFRRQTVAIEPCTAPANALRSGVDLDLIAPGESLRLEWGLGTSW